MIGKKVTMHIIIQGKKYIGKKVSSGQENQIKIHVIKDTGVINQISILVNYILNDKV